MSEGMPELSGFSRRDSKGGVGQREQGMVGEFGSEKLPAERAEAVSEGEGGNWELGGRSLCEVKNLDG